MIYVECKPDTIMANVLSCGREVKHMAGTSRVCRKLSEQNDCRGFIDGHFPAIRHPYIKEIKKSGSIRTQRQYSLTIFEDIPKNNRLILLMPRLEEWVLQAARKANINVRNYHLPSNADELHDLLELGNRETMAQFRMLVQLLKRKSDQVQCLFNLLK